MLMRNDDAVALCSAWLDAFSIALRQGPQALLPLFEDDCYWRDMVALSWGITTIGGCDDVAAQLALAASREGLCDLTIDHQRISPTTTQRADRDVIEAVFQFRTRHGRGTGLLRLPAAEPQKAWTLMTSLDEVDLAMPAATDFHAGENWAQLRQRVSDFSNRDPQVLVVGAGHAGLCAAAELGQLGIDTLVIDREKRAGDNWRLRYHNLSLHNQIDVNHLPYMPFPENWPLYIPKDKLANWLEMYVEAMEINLWLQCTLRTADYRDGRWHAELTMGDGSCRIVKPAHIVMATSVSGPPKRADIPTLEQFVGTVQHSSEFNNGDVWRDKSALVFGTGTSAHDVACNLSNNGAMVTMVQRSPTMVLNMEPSAQLYDAMYIGRQAWPLANLDLIASSVPFPLLRRAHKKVTDHIRELDAELHRGLEAAGFRLEFGEDGTGWPLKYRTRGGGYYFNSGASDRIIDGRIGLIQYSDIDHFLPHGIALSDGREIPAELVILATGYHNQESVVEQIFGQKIRQAVGPIWGLDERQELRNMWTRTPQPGLWFTAGAFAQCRIYSRFMALQIVAIEHGLISASLD
jgi:putative flavoprotein involved in K+ transport